jgi:hypothetical protein
LKQVLEECERLREENEAASYARVELFDI